ncbi:hypothetical protein [Nonomuraea soli]|uniref:Uncharacterized protein n=1 Tax=Nonomuraea soli TaxID=1032476 RepID=A0A7W0CDZ6_9ACTN|nr:hypothetical protein [Nonomuraea soli]MBA2889235.1 hypothetical protein [Nonomuraea soli]
MAKAFWLDRGDSRYATHVRKNVHEFADSWGDIAPVTFACTAWHIATPPFLTPGHVHRDPRILHAHCLRNTWDGSLTAEVRLAAPLPESLDRSRAAWWRDRGWQGWQRTLGQYVEPTQHDLTRSPFLRASLLMQAPIPLSELPPAPEGPHDGVEDRAQRALIVLVKELNALLSPILGQLGP